MHSFSVPFSKFFFLCSKPKDLDFLRKDTRNERASLLWKRYGSRKRSRFPEKDAEGTRSFNVGNDWCLPSVIKWSKLRNKRLNPIGCKLWRSLLNIFFSVQLLQFINVYFWLQYVKILQLYHEWNWLELNLIEIIDW